MSDVRKLVSQVLDGERLTPEEGLFLYENAALPDLMPAAARVRERFSQPETVTYLVDRNVNYTNVCITDCKFCEFYRPPGHDESYVLDREQMSKKLTELRDAGGTRVLLQGGHHPDLPISWYEELLTWMRDEFPTIERDAFSPPEIEHISHVEGIPVRDVLKRLKDAGLDGVPGGGGEILDDEIRTQVSPKKTKTAAWLDVMDGAHELDLYTSASMVFGFGEKPKHRVNSFTALRQQQDRSLERYGRGFMAFISWPLQYESRYGRVFSGLKGWKLGGSADDYLFHTAFARLFLDNIPHFQVSWPTMGLAVAKDALRAGCDDMGGTMMEENVVSQAGSVHSCVTEQQVRSTVEAAGFTPRKRNSRYHALEPTGDTP
ncbi:MAG: CofH family radical SAM protein [Planctomycetota bacterium]|nr:CofH family radical SAM protein [Planctomycetota bacterium]